MKKASKTKKKKKPAKTSVKKKPAKKAGKKQKAKAKKKVMPAKKKKAEPRTKPATKKPVKKRLAVPIEVAQLPEEKPLTKKSFEDDEDDFEDMPMEDDIKFDELSGLDGGDDDEEDDFYNENYN